MGIDSIDARGVVLDACEQDFSSPRRIGNRCQAAEAGYRSAFPAMNGGFKYFLPCRRGAVRSFVNRIVDGGVESPVALGKARHASLRCRAANHVSLPFRLRIPDDTFLRAMVRTNEYGVRRSCKDHIDSSNLISMEGE